MRQSLYSNNTQHSRRCRKEVHTKRIRESGALIRASFGKTISTATVPGPQNCKCPALAESHSPQRCTRPLHWPSAGHSKIRILRVQFQKSTVRILIWKSNIYTVQIVLGTDFEYVGITDSEA